MYGVDRDSEGKNPRSVQAIWKVGLRVLQVWQVEPPTPVLPQAVLSNETGVKPGDGPHQKRIFLSLLGVVS